MRAKVLLFVSVCVMILFVFTSDLVAELKLYDDFSGSEVDEILWETDCMSPPLYQSGGYLKADGPPYLTNGCIFSEVLFYGDFQVILDWDFVFTPPTSSPWNEYYQAGLNVEDALNSDLNQFYITRCIMPTFEEPEVINYLDCVAPCIRKDGVNLITSVQYVTATSGRFKIVRSGATMKAYYYIGDGWVLSASISDFFTGPAMLHLSAQMGDAGSLHVAYDRIVVEGIVCVPDVLDMTENEAEIALKGSGLVKGTVNHENSPTVPVDHVMGQNPVDGTLLDFLSAVDIVISDGPGSIILLPDLIGEFGRLRFRSPLTSGDRVRTQIYVTNIGLIPTLSKQLIDIELCLRPCNAVNDDDDIDITTLGNISVSKLKPGKSKKINVRLSLPVDSDGSEYRLVAKIDSSEDVLELVETNNEALSECFEIVVE